MKRARFVAAARQEFIAEVAYYSEAQNGLGERFATAVEEAAARGDFSCGRLFISVGNSPRYREGIPVLTVLSP